MTGARRWRSPLSAPMNHPPTTASEASHILVIDEISGFALFTLYPGAGPPDQSQSATVCIGSLITAQINRDRTAMHAMAPRAG